MRDIDNDIKSYYNNKSLSASQLETIKNGLGRRKKVKLQLRYAAVIVFIISALFIIQYLYSNQQKEKLLYQYAEEVAFNHNKALESDYVTKDIDSLNLVMTKLNFNIELPQNITSNYQLLGGRYCSVKKRMAAQLKLKNQESQIVTLYVLDKLKHENLKKSVQIEDIDIDIWNHNHQLLLLAKTE